MGASIGRREFAGALGMALCRGALAQAPVSEYEVKSAMLVNFARFVDWPAAAFANPKQPLVIGVLGGDPFGSALDEIAKEKSVSGRPIQIRRFETWPPPEAVHVLFLPQGKTKAEKRRLESLLPSLASLPVLTVSDHDGFAAKGGVIGFLLEDGKVRFEVNLEAAEKAGLSLSSKLLRLAAGTRPRAGKG